jgi:four helix bundle protein
MSDLDKQTDNRWRAQVEQRPRHQLEVWRLAKELAVEIYMLSGHFPDCEKYGLTSQLRRAGNSVQSNIAEGAARDTDRDFRRFLYQARGSLEEVDCQLELAGELGYLDELDVSSLAEKFNHLSRGLTGLINFLTDRIAKASTG